jgi:peptide methionine sulfoxide reductase msrA/msrB
MNYNKLNDEEKRVILDKGTEHAFIGEYTDNKKKGIYICKQCNSALYMSEDKFDSGCGWPSFDDEISGAVDKQPDPDGMRVEITCSKCDGHLGHVFVGENITPKNTRHCVNSISLKFIPAEKTERAIFASGCFWGTEYHLQKQIGVIHTNVGYIGGYTENPTYQEVCSGQTNHAEAVEVFFNNELTDFETLAKVYFETHDPTQVDGQGPDIGTQYRSEIFVINEEQRETSKKLIDILKEKGVNVVTAITNAPKFWPAEGYHQDYYENKGQKPYCHIYQKKF